MALHNNPFVQIIKSSHFNVQHFYLYMKQIIIIINNWVDKKKKKNKKHDHYNFSRALVFVRSSRVSLQTCLAAFSSPLGDLPLKRSKFGKK